ncbi:histidine phosphatase family protein [Paenarthrobacter sp. DKR-5]|uniref:histidine phosphatase family protein n=1 Tax=Paenarthrobacter sp. DKR-5 TaxID=2835535 RepID=UPI001BDCA952|nr:histidine phosphatase family protein [Paenarthrobacter sp. DKR-5]MBT1003312.1 histidine phosphatase family protein [Paenarthrobacter sp. DKR-5]
MGAVELILVRHGESEGNLVATAAQAAGSETIDTDRRDADVPLSGAGRRQAEAVGKWLSSLAPSQFPQSAWCSPYRRARETAELAGLEFEPEFGMRLDERLRDRELGVLDMLTRAGVEARYPEEARRREWLGKFYYRPPGGESWADVALRLRSLLAELDQLEEGRRVAVVCHDAVILLLRYVCEGLTEEHLLSIASTSTVRNGSVTRLVRPSGKGLWELESFNEVDHLEAGGAPVTDHAGDTNVHPR